MKKRGKKKGTIHKLYTVYNNKTDLPVIIDGTAEQTAEAMGMSIKTFYPTVARSIKGINKKWYVEVIDKNEVEYGY